MIAWHEVPMNSVFSMALLCLRMAACAILRRQRVPSVSAASKRRAVSLEEIGSATRCGRALSHATPQGHLNCLLGRRLSRRNAGSCVATHQASQWCPVAIRRRRPSGSGSWIQAMVRRGCQQWLIDREGSRRCDAAFGAVCAVRARTMWICTGHAHRASHPRRDRHGRHLLRDALTEMNGVLAVATIPAYRTVSQLCSALASTIGHARGLPRCCVGASTW